MPDDKRFLKVKLSFSIVKQKKNQQIATIFFPKDLTLFFFNVFLWRT
jgi:hypothetical protein